MDDYIKGSIVNKWIKITERDGGTVTIASQDFEIFDDGDSSVQASATASISGNGTATVYIYGLADTSAEAFTAGESYYMRFTAVIGAETLIKDVWFALT